MIKANGHIGTVEQVARAILAENGTTDPHPMLLADTMREVEYHGEIVEPSAYLVHIDDTCFAVAPEDKIDADAPTCGDCIERATVDADASNHRHADDCDCPLCVRPEWEIVRDEWEVPCDHPLCALLHRRYYEGSERHTERVDLPSGVVKYIEVRGSHFAKRYHWLVLHNGVRVDEIDPCDTKRDAIAALARALRS